MDDIQSGKLGTRRAAAIYRIPRSTLRNKVYKLTMEQKSSNNHSSTTGVSKTKLMERLKGTESGSDSPSPPSSSSCSLVPNNSSLLNSIVGYTSLDDCQQAAMLKTSADLLRQLTKPNSINETIVSGQSRLSSVLAEQLCSSPTSTAGEDSVSNAESQINCTTSESTTSLSSALAAQLASGPLKAIIQQSSEHVAPAFTQGSQLAELLSAQPTYSNSLLNNGLSGFNSPFNPLWTQFLVNLQQLTLLKQQQQQQKFDNPCVQFPFAKQSDSRFEDQNNDLELVETDSGADRPSSAHSASTLRHEARSPSLTPSLMSRPNSQSSAVDTNMVLEERLRNNLRKSFTEDSSAIASSTPTIQSILQAAPEPRFFNQKSNATNFATIDNSNNSSGLPFDLNKIIGAVSGGESNRVDSSPQFQTPTHASPTVDDLMSLNPALLATIQANPLLLTQLSNLSNLNQLTSQLNAISGNRMPLHSLNAFNGLVNLNAMNAFGLAQNPFLTGQSRSSLNNANVLANTSSALPSNTSTGSAAALVQLAGQLRSPQLSSALAPNQSNLPLNLNPLSNGTSNSSSSTSAPTTLSEPNNPTVSDNSRKRPKRGRYRNYNRDDLAKAVKAVQRGEMSVHRAGTFFGVPHSTLEYKVKERHLLRPKKRIQKTITTTESTINEASLSASFDNSFGNNPTAPSAGDSHLTSGEVLSQSTLNLLKMNPNSAPVVLTSANVVSENSPSSVASTLNLNSSAEMGDGLARLKRALTTTSTSSNSCLSLSAPANSSKLLSDLTISTEHVMPFWSNSNFNPSMMTNNQTSTTDTSAATNLLTGSNFFASNMMRKLQQNARLRNDFSCIGDDEGGKDSMSLTNSTCNSFVEPSFFLESLFKTAIPEPIEHLMSKSLDMNNKEPMQQLGHQ